MSRLILPRRFREGNSIATPRRNQRGFIINPYALGGTPATDPFWSSVVAMLHMDGTNGSTTFTDSKGLHTWTALFGAVISTAQSKFGGASGIFTVSTNSHLTSPSSADWNFGTGDFTIDFQVYFTSSTRAYIFEVPSNTSALIITPSSGLVEVYGPGSYVINTGSTPFALNTWHACRLVRSGNTWRFLRGGTSYVSATDSRSWGSSVQSFLIGKSSSGSTITLGGYLDEFRITKGVARDSGGAYTPQTAAFPNS